LPNLRQFTGQACGKIRKGSDFENLKKDVIYKNYQAKKLAQKLRQTDL